jgi:hypothetical protein
MVILSGGEMNEITRTAFEQGAVPTSGRWRTQACKVYRERGPCGRPLPVGGLGRDGSRRWATAPTRAARRINVGKSIPFECFEVPQRTR